MYGRCTRGQCAVASRLSAFRIDVVKIIGLDQRCVRGVAISLPIGKWYQVVLRHKERYCDEDLTFVWTIAGMLTGPSGKHHCHEVMMQG